MGGGTSIEQPSPPAQPTVAQSMSDYVQNYPALFALQQEYAPQEAAMQVELAQKYAQPMGQAYKTAQEAMYPEAAAITEAMNKQVQEGIKEEMPSWMKDQ